MKARQPTPGPWVVCPHSSADKLLRIGGPDGVTVDFDDVDHEQQEIDARLIAAAPAMFALIGRIGAGKGSLQDLQNEALIIHSAVLFPKEG